MDESEQKPEDIPVTESVTSASQHVSDSEEADTGKPQASADSTPATPHGPQGGSSKTSPSSASTDSSHQASGQESFAAPSEQISGDGAGKLAGSAEREAAKNKEAGGRKGGEEDGSLARASQGRGAPPGEGAGGPGSSDVMAKMMEMMAKGSASATPKAPGDPKGDMMAKGSMPDMMAMMAKGGMPDMMAMMMDRGGDMKAMMSQMKGGPMGMAKLFDCIIDVSLAKPDSDSSDDDEDGINIEIPCQYCSRLFTSQMTLKTHILVNHEHEDSSVLNIKKLVIDKGKRSIKDHLGTRRKQSKDCERSAGIEAASTDSLQPASSEVSKVTASQDDSWAAESSRGLKRSRRESGGAAGVEEGGQVRDQVPHRPVSGAVPSGCITVSPPESRKRSARLRSLRSESGDGPSPRVTTKKSKSGDSKPDSDSSSPESSPPLRPSSRGAKSGDEASNTADSKSQESAGETKLKANKKPSKPPSPTRHAPVTRVTRVSRKDKDAVSSDTDIAAEAPPSGASPSKGRQSSSVPAVGVKGRVASSSPRGTEAVPASRRSLRSRLSN